MPLFVHSQSVDLESFGSSTPLTLSGGSSITGAGAMWIKGGGDLLKPVAKLDEAGEVEYFLRNVDEKVAEDELELAESFYRNKEIGENTLGKLPEELKNKHVDQLVKKGEKLAEAKWAKFEDEFGDLLGDAKEAFKADFANSPVLLDEFAKNPKLVEAWSSFKKAGFDDLARNTDNLEALNKALKQDGYDAAYFEELLMSKSDPQKFIDDYLSKIGDNGKFADDALESDYASYLTRKYREGKPPRDCADWNHIRDYMLNDSPLARGNDFNRKAWDEEWYPFWEVYLDNGKYLDDYNPITKEVVSRKATDLVDISESTYRKYLDELLEKYAPPRTIKSQKPGYESLFDKPIPNDVKLILEIPESNRSFFDIDKYTQIASEKGITIKFAPE